MTVSKDRVYLDYASATPISAGALRVMRKAEKLAGNPSSIHKEGVEAKRMLEMSRAQIAAELGCKAREIVFTSGITESNNLAILGFARGREISGKPIAGTHWIVSSIEHSSVLECFAEIERLGGIVSHVDPDARGIITPQSVARLLRKDTIFVSIGWANNEIGVIQPLSQIAQALREHEQKEESKIIFHTDIGQGILYRALQVHTLGVDMLVLGSVKIYGPHGIGALYAGNRLFSQAGAALAPVILGGGQERGLRSGTENPALAAGFAEALKESAHNRGKEAKRILKLRDELARSLATGIRGAIINGDLKRALPHMLNISIPGIKSEYLMLALDNAGIAVSTKSACGEAGDRSSHVVARLRDAQAREGKGDATPGTAWRAENTLRFSLGRGTTAADIRKAARNLLDIIQNSNI